MLCQFGMPLPRFIVITTMPLGAFPSTSTTVQGVHSQCLLATEHLEASDEG